MPVEASRRPETTADELEALMEEARRRARRRRIGYLAAALAAALLGAGALLLFGGGGGSAGPGGSVRLSQARRQPSRKEASLKRVLALSFCPGSRWCTTRMARPPGLPRAANSGSTPLSRRDGTRIVPRPPCFHRLARSRHLSARSRPSPTRRGSVGRPLHSR